MHFDPFSKFIRFVGVPTITDCTNGQNAFGSVLAVYDDGTKFDLICGHGDFRWLCLSCAERAINEQKEIDSLQK